MKIRAGLEDVRAYVDGDRDGFAVHEVEIPEPIEDQGHEPDQDDTDTPTTMSTDGLFCLSVDN